MRVCRNSGVEPSVAVEVDELVIVLAEAIHADARVVVRGDGAHRDLRARVDRTQVMDGAHRRTAGISIVVGGIRVHEGRDGQNVVPDSVRTQVKSASASRSRSTSRTPSSWAS